MLIPVMYVPQSVRMVYKHVRPGSFPLLRARHIIIVSTAHGEIRNFNKCLDNNSRNYVFMQFYNAPGHLTANVRQSLNYKC